MAGANWATVIFATRSAIELPIAKTARQLVVLDWQRGNLNILVRPIIASLNPINSPIDWSHISTHLNKSGRVQWGKLTWRTETTSSAIAAIQTMLQVKPPKHLTILQNTLVPSLASIVTATAPAIPASKQASKIHHTYSISPTGQILQPD